MDKYLFYFKTTKTNNIKKLFEVLKEIVQRDFTLVIDTDAIRMNKKDDDTLNVISMKLESSEFEKYYCPEKVKVMLYSKDVYIITKTILNTDIVSFYILKDDPYLLKISNSDKSDEIRSISSVTRLDCENQLEMKIGDVLGYNTTKILCSKFNKICKDFNNLSSDHIIITDLPDSIMFSCKTEDFTQQVTIKQENSSGVKKSNTTSISGKYKLKPIIPFIKGVNLTDNDNNIIKLHITDNGLLVVEYSIGCLGTIKLITVSYPK